LPVLRKKTPATLAGNITNPLQAAATGFTVDPSGLNYFVSVWEGSDYENPNAMNSKQA
jgi:hypothetical protein